MKQRITLKIAGKETSHEIEPEKEEVLRAAVERINREIDSLKFDYRDKDLTEILSIVLLSEEKKLIEYENGSRDKNKNLLSRLEELDESLGQYLSR